MNCNLIMYCTLLNMKCDTCDNTAFSILDLICDKCDKRLCRKCAEKYKCEFCRIPYCECHGVMCPNEIEPKEWWKSDFHTLIKYNLVDWEDKEKLYSIVDDDVEFLNTIHYHLPLYRFTCTDKIPTNQVVKRGKLTIEFARYLASCIKNGILHENSCTRDESINHIGNEEIHRETDKFLYWYIESMQHYTIEEAQEIANLIKDFDTSQFWYA